MRVRLPIRCHRLSIESFQVSFHARWSGLRDPHVRALAWLIFAPDLLDPKAAQWHGKITSLPLDPEAERWLHWLDLQPEALHGFLCIGPFERLGRYAEKLLAFYFQHQKRLVAHGVQVPDSNNQTVGEFDFLLRSGENLVHWEFATKLYLMEGNREGDCFIGPNLADTLQAKMRKILDRQLALSLHPAAQALLPATVFRAQALIKGWLFYRQGELGTQHAGVTLNHCRGFWCTHAEVNMLDAESFVVLPRLSWLAPIQIDAALALDRVALLHKLDAHFATDAMPVLLAQCRDKDGLAQEISRGFVVPNDWRMRAGQRAQRSCIAAQ